MELDCAVQKYAWGKMGSTSLVAQLARANNNTPINEQERYAELWMGTHPSGPSMISGTNESLLSYLQANNDSLGEKEKQVFGTDLPFLFKALSVAKALSIQAHPNKVHLQMSLIDLATLLYSLHVVVVVGYRRFMPNSCLHLVPICTRIQITSQKWSPPGWDLSKLCAVSALLPKSNSLSKVKKKKIK